MNYLEKLDVILTQIADALSTTITNQIPDVDLDFLDPIINNQLKALNGSLDNLGSWVDGNVSIPSKELQKLGVPQSVITQMENQKSAFIAKITDDLKNLIHNQVDQLKDLLEQELQAQVDKLKQEIHDKIIKLKNKIRDAIADYVANTLTDIPLGIFIVTIDLVNYIVTIKIELDSALEFQIPGFGGLQFIINKDNKKMDLVFTYVYKGNNTLTIKDVDLTIRFPKKWLRPVEWDKNKAKWVELEDKFAEITEKCSFQVDENGNFSELDDTWDSLEVGPWMIGNTGFVLESDSISLITSNTKANEKGLSDPNWRGIIFNTGHLYIPFSEEKTPPYKKEKLEQVTFENLMLGGDGLSGNILWEKINRKTYFQGFEFKLKEFELEFQQNSIIFCRIFGSLQNLMWGIEEIDIEISVTDDGDFTASLTSLDKDGFFKISQKGDDGKNIFTLMLKTIEFEYTDSGYLIRFSGKIKIDLFSTNMVDIDSLTVQNGNVSLQGAWLQLNSIIPSLFNGFPIQFSHLNLSSFSDKGYSLGLKGGIKLLEQLPQIEFDEGLFIKGVSGKSPSIDLSGLKVKYDIPNVLSFDGKVAYGELDDSIQSSMNLGKNKIKCFRGGVKLNLKPFNMTLDAQLLVGKFGNNAEVFYLYFDSELPAGIPLFSTGLSLYGIKLLFGYNIKPNKKSSETWYDWAKSGSNGTNCTDVSKWIGSGGDYAFGAGCMIGTTADDGYLFKTNVVMVLLIPGPVIILNGKANFLTKADPSEGAFDALAVLDCRAGNLMFNIDANYKVADGNILDISGSTETFFDFNDPLSFYLHLGKNQPESKRLKAKFLSLFEANSYFMIGKYDVDGVTKYGVATGAKIGYDRKWKFGPVKVKLGAFIEGNAYINWLPEQIGGDLWVEGDVDISCFGIGIGLSVGAGLAVNLPNPYLIRGEFRAKINLPWPLPDPKVKVVLEWKEDKKLDPFPNPVARIGIEHLKTSEKIDLIVYSQLPTNEKDILNQLTNGDQIFVPLDSRPVVTFSKSMMDYKQIPIGVNTINLENSLDRPESIRFPELMPPYKPKNGIQYEIKYELGQIYLEYKNKTSEGWKNIEQDPTFGAKITGTWLADKPIPTNDIKNIKEYYEKKGLKHSQTKLMLWNKTPYDFYRELTDFDFEALNVDYMSACPKVGEPKWKEITFKGIKIETENPSDEDKTSSGEPDIPTIEESNEDIFFLTMEGFIITLQRSERDIIPLSTFLFAKIGFGSNNNYSSNMGSSNSTGSDFTYILTNFGLKLPSQTNPLVIEFPEKAILSKVTLHKLPFDITPLISYEVYLENELVYKVQSIKILNEIVTLPINSNNKPMTKIVISGENVALEKIEYISFAEAEEKLKYDAWLKMRNNSIETCLSASNYLLKPRTYYRLMVETKVNYRKKGDSKWQIQSPTFNTYAYFKTSEPPGLEYNKNFKEINNLKHYIKRKIPDSMHLKTNKLYRDYDVGCEYNETYVDQIYAMIEEPIFVKFFDQNGNSSKAIKNEWSNSLTMTASIEEEIWSNVLEECGIVPNPQHKIITSKYPSRLETLKPNTLYCAKLMTKDQKSNDFSVYDFNFETSKYSNFTHHLHSYTNIVWKLKTSFDLDQLKKLILDISSNKIQKKLQFESVKNLLKLNYRPNPSNMEITTIGNETEKYCLLLESPEPIDWNRIELKIQKSSSYNVLNPATGFLKIIDYSITGSDKWVDVLVQDDINPTGYSIQYFGNPLGILSNPEAAKKMFYRFSEKDIVPGGTIYRIHETKNNNSNNEIGFRIHRFMEDCAEYNKNTYKASPVNNTGQGDVFFIYNTKNTLQQMEVAIPNSIFQDVKDIMLIPSNDGTRTFIFFTTNPPEIFSALDKNVRLRLNFKYKLNINVNSGDDNIVLKRSGKSDPESAFIEIGLSDKSN